MDQDSYSQYIFKEVLVYVGVQMQDIADHLQRVIPGDESMELFEGGNPKEHYRFILSKYLELGGIFGGR